MIVYRIAKEKYAWDLSGKGAEKAGGRWNSKGIPLIYTSSSRALCTVEIAVHLPLGILPKNFVLLTISIPENIKIAELNFSQLPKDWDSFPQSDSTQQLGDAFVIQNEFLVLKVPSVAVKEDYNFLINPQHPLFSKVNIIESEPFEFDGRLFFR